MITTAIIGANGFFGRRFANALIKSSHDVTCVYNTNKINLPGECNQIGFSDFLKRNYRYDNIIFAAGNFKNSYQELVELNCKAMLKLTQQYADSRILYISSTNVYGLHKEVIKEDSTYNNPSIYAQSKLAGEFIVSANPNFSIARLTYLYGPGLNNQSFIPTIMDTVVNTGIITLMGKGERVQDYLYIDDAVSFCFRILESNQNGIFLGASGTSYSNLEVAKMLSNNLQNCCIKFTGEEKGQSYRFDPSITFAKLKWIPRISLSEGIKRSMPQ